MFSNMPRHSNNKISCLSPCGLSLGKGETNLEEGSKWNKHLAVGSTLACWGWTIFPLAALLAKFCETLPLLTLPSLDHDVGCWCSGWARAIFLCPLPCLQQLTSQILQEKKVRKKWWQNNHPRAIRIYEAWLAKPMEPELTCRRDWSKSIRRTLQRLSSQHQGGTRTSRVPQITVHE